MILSVMEAHNAIDIFNKLVAGNYGLNFKNNLKIVKILGKLQASLQEAWKGLQISLEPFGEQNNSMFIPNSDENKSQAEAIFQNYLQEEIEIEELLLDAADLEKTDLSINEISAIIKFIA